MMQLFNIVMWGLEGFTLFSFYALNIDVDIGGGYHDPQVPTIYTRKIFFFSQKLSFLQP